MTHSSRTCLTKVGLPPGNEQRNAEAFISHRRGAGTARAEEAEEGRLPPFACGDNTNESAAAEVYYSLNWPCAFLWFRLSPFQSTMEGALAAGDGLCPGGLLVGFDCGPPLPRLHICVASSAHRSCPSLGSRPARWRLLWRESSDYTLRRRPRCRTH